MNLFQKKKRKEMKTRKQKQNKRQSEPIPKERKKKKKTKCTYSRKRRGSHVTWGRITEKEALLTCAAVYHNNYESPTDGP